MTYRSLICALMKACFWRAANKELSPNTATERFGDPDVRNPASMYSPVRMAVAIRQFYGVRRIPLSFFVLVEHDGKLADARRDGENCQNHQDS